MIVIADEALQLRQLSESDLPALQAFYEANPEYSLLVNGRAPEPDEAHAEFFDPPPPAFSHGTIHVIGIYDSSANLVGATGVVTDLFAAGVWHVGIYIIATALHGSGLAQHAYRLLEKWMEDSGAQWLRLGVVADNVRAERFWARAGYVEVRQREGVAMGERVHCVRVMVKPLTSAPLAQYLSIVGRDRPDN